MFGSLTPTEEAMLDNAVIQTYAVKDIYPDQDYSGKEPPLLSDLENILASTEGAETLVVRLQKYTQGTFAGFLNKPTTIAIDKQLSVFSIRDMEEELRPIAMYVVLNYIWSRVRKELRKRLMIVDEAWTLMKYEEGANFMLNVAKRARKYYLGLTTISQDVGDFLNSPYGRPIITNSSLQLLLKQSPATIDLVQKTFNLTESEKNLLLETTVGTGLFFAGQNHIVMRIVASYTEDQLITSDPRQLLEIQEAKKELGS
jgi:type IV secretory pathway VirB4 component